VSDQNEFLRLLLAAETDLRAFVRSVLRDSAAVDDVFQETALVLWQRFAEFDPARPFGAWARGVAAKKLLQRRDQESRFPRTLSPEAIQRVSEAFDRLESTSEVRRQDALEECLARLPEKSRELIQSRYGDERRPQQIAEETGRTIAAVYHMLSRVRSQLEDCIRQRLRAWDGVGQ
jgi:RNA polymerase sigma-70 factor (ECF subfamily)